MRGEQLQLEAVSQAVRRAVGMESDDFADAVRITTAFLGDGAIVYDAALEGVAYLRRRPDGSFVVVLKPGLPDIRFRLLHEVAHVALRRFVGDGLSIAEEERSANYVAAAIIAPADLVKRAVSHYGSGFGAIRSIATAFGMSPTSAELRIGEVVGGERGVATKSGRLLVPNFGPTQLTLPWRSARGADRDSTVKRVLARARARGLAADAGAIDEERIAIRVK